MTCWSEALDFDSRLQVIRKFRRSAEFFLSIVISVGISRRYKKRAVDSNESDAAREYAQLI
jgi:hypothetical protein